MHETRTFLADLAVVLSVAAVTTVIFRRLRQPVVLGYLLAGLIVGPYIPIPLFADAERIHAVSELGVILVMFSVGLELSVRKLLRVVPTSGIIGIVQISTMMWLGYLVGQAFGWTSTESIFVGAMVSISSTMIVAKVFAEQKVPKGLSDKVFGVLVVQDLAAVVLLAVLTAISAGDGLSSSMMGYTALRLAGFLLAIVVVGFLTVPRATRAIVRLGSPETLLVASMGLCFGLALLAKEVGYSVALGAFLAGSLVAESGEAHRVEHLIQPVRDMFAAIFFVSVGMILDPKVVVSQWLAVVVLVGLVIVGQTLSITVGALASGTDVKTSVQTGMSLAQIGEFSFIIAALGVERGAIGSFLYPVAVAVSVVTTFTTPGLVRSSGRVAAALDRRLPKPLQTFISVYSSWVEQARAGSPDTAKTNGTRRLFRLLALDAFLFAAIVVGTATNVERLASLVDTQLHLPGSASRMVVLAVASVLAIPFLFGALRLAKNLGATLAAKALPAAENGNNDVTPGARKALAFVLELMIIVGATGPVFVITQPFVPATYGVAAALVLFGLVGWGLFRSATTLDQQVQAGTQRIIEALGRQSAVESAGPEATQSLLPGFGPLTPVKLAKDSPAIGKTLVGVNLRALSGASVITILRKGTGMRPTGKEALEEGDVLALAGTHAAIAAATALLRGEDG